MSGEGWGRPVSCRGLIEAAAAADDDDDDDKYNATR